MRVEVYAKRIDRRIVPARGACGVSSEGTHGRRGTRRVRTEDEGVVTGNIEAPLAQIMVHLHREHRQVLVQVKVYGSGRVEARVGVYYVALGLRQPEC